MKIISNMLFALAILLIGVWVTIPSYGEYSVAEFLIYLDLISFSAAFVFWVWAFAYSKYVKLLAFALLVIGSIFIFPLTLDKINEWRSAAKSKEDIARYAGTLQPRQSKVLFDSEKPDASIEFGEHGAKFSWPSGKGGILMKGFKLQVERVDFHVYVSTTIRDKDGNILAQISKNEWEVVPPPGTLDRNYNDDTLEVIDRRGSVVLRVKALTDRVQVQGEFRDIDGNGFIVFDDALSDGAIFHPLRKDENALEIANIKPVFVYPSQLHMHQLLSSSLQ